MNKAILIGRLTKAPVISYTAEQKAVARFTLAVDRYKGDTDFLPCVAFGSRAEFAEKYLTQGKKVSIVGNIKTGSYTNKDGVKVYTTDIIVDEVEFCESKAAQVENGLSQINAPVETGFTDIPNDMELPFS